MNLNYTRKISIIIPALLTAHKVTLSYTDHKALIWSAYPSARTVIQRRKYGQKEPICPKIQ